MPIGNPSCVISTASHHAVPLTLGGQIEQRKTQIVTMPAAALSPMVHDARDRILNVMVIALLTASLLSILCFLYTAWLGFAVHGPAGIGQHFLFGFFTTFLVTLAQSMTMFFFI